MNAVERFMQSDTTNMVIGFLAFGVAIAIVIVIYRFITRKLIARARKTPGRIDDVVIDVLKVPFLVLLIWIMFRIFSQTAFYDTRYFSGMNHVLRILLIITVGWILIKGTRVLFYYMEHKLTSEAVSNFHVRGSLTKLKIFERMIKILIVVVVVAVSLMTFDKIRTVGISLLTSAGIAGIIVGFAA